MVKHGKDRACQPRVGQGSDLDDRGALFVVVAKLLRSLLPLPWPPHYLKPVAQVREAVPFPSDPPQGLLLEAVAVVASAPLALGPEGGGEPWAFKRGPGV